MRTRSPRDDFAIKERDVVYVSVRESAQLSWVGISVRPAKFKLRAARTGGEDRQLVASQRSRPVCTSSAVICLW